MADGLFARADDLFPRSGGLHPPSSVIASWPAPNYENPTTRGWTGPILLIAILALTLTVHAARMWARIKVAKNAGLDDLLMSIAMVPLMGLTITVILGSMGSNCTLGIKLKTTLITSRKSTLAIEVLYLVATCLIKISILCFYRRITNGTISRTFIYWVWGSIVLVVCYGVIFIFVIIFSCSPVKGYWRLFDLMWRLKNDVKCHNEAAEIVSVVVISTLQDLFICALPIFLVWNLQIPLRQKVALTGIFALGLLTCVCGIMRTYYAIYVYYYTYDITWYAFYGWIWTALEADLGVICASAPALKVFFRRYFNLSANRSGNSDSYGKRSARSDKASGKYPWSSLPSIHHGNETDISTEVPLNQIKVSRGMDVKFEDRDDAVSQASYASTKELTAIPSASSEWPGSPSTGWVEGCRTVCAAVGPESEDSSGNMREDVDIERDAVNR
ncbi:hypothetical protein K469DRAFT_686649 [Zopfia rhizophila CBS 207.26]|uniref:Rhodopsin domain-containing protein n=1 Tax=Zopfia rhizophila CBS 207.26 TaxID=1314779 RepID=A0A6A6EUH1_9PEZI|nr:hypothetical protein K469DRAFT_686649 [Zopfia rhizophila CBS 207.26]